MTPRNLAGLMAVVAPLGLAACATGSAVPVTALPDSFALGRASNGEPCVASRNFKDRMLQGARRSGYLINCRGSAASRAVGTVSAVPAGMAMPADEMKYCGPASTVTLAGFGPVQAQRCFDPALAAPTVVVNATRGGYRLRGSAVPSVVGPMEGAFKALAGTAPVPTGTTADAPASITLASLADAPMVDAAMAAREGAFDPAIPLREGILLNRQGLYVEASRVLNDAISRLPQDAPADVRVELGLEAGLADSNIRFTEASAEHFQRAEQILASDATIANRAFLERKRTTYRALDALNRRDWKTALSALAVAAPESPLEDPTLLAEANRARVGARDASNSVGGEDAGRLSQLVIDAQRSWASSVAVLAQGGAGSLSASQTELGRAVANLDVLLGGQIDPASILWLTAQVERQAGRIDLRRGEAAGGSPADIQAAVAKFDCALAALEGARPASEAGCAIRLDPEERARLMRAGGRVSGPIVAETQMERASLLKRSGAPTATVLNDYNSAVDALIASNRTGGAVPAGLETYLDLLSDEAAANPQSDAAERFFRAIQAIGEPAIARQMSQLQSVVTSDGTTGARVRDRAELNRQITSLRYAIAAPSTDAETRARLEAERTAKQQELDAVEAALGADKRYANLDDRPATVAEIQAALTPGEAYWKLVELRARVYGVVIGRDRVRVYPVKESARNLNTIARVVRRSIRDVRDNQKLPFYNVSASAALYQLIAGPARDQLAAAKSIVVDPGGPLSDLPAGVLVTDAASAKAYAASRAKAPNDYSKVAFLAARADLSTALSPRSFLISRALSASAASKPFIGFGEHSAPTSLPQLASAAPVSLGLGCPIELTELATVSAQNEPISATKIALAEQALGVTGAPMVTGPAFTDAAVRERKDLDQYQVLLFATHGLPETKYGCTSIPPSLLTTIGGEGSDGFLSFREIADLRLDANLVVLAACETSAGASQRLARSSGQEEGGRSLDGLVRAFLTANARAVLATYWTVSVDQESDELFRAFYTRGRTATIGDALRAAQTELMQSQRYSHPYYWGAYFLVGDASKRMLSAPGGGAPAASR